MIFFGWGRKSLTKQLREQHALVLHYQYLHVMWLFRLSFPQGYSLATLTPNGWATRRLGDAEIEQHGFRQALQVHWWWRWGLLIGVGAIVLILVGGALGGGA